MNMKGKYSACACHNKMRVIRTSGCGPWSSVCGLWLVACWLFASFAVAETSAEPTAVTDSAQSGVLQTPEKTDTPNAFKGPKTGPGRKMWRSWISAPGVKNDLKSQTELEQLINQVLSIELEPQKPPVKPVPPAEPLLPILPVEPAPLIEPNEEPITTEPPEEPKYINAEPNLPSHPVASQTLQLVKQLVQHPDRVANPFELAEVLSSNGNSVEAAVFYKEALKRKSTDEAWLASNKAWTLLQIANCLRYSDIAVAKQMYQQVVVECPDSLWTDLAKTQYEIINWYETENPSALVSDQVLQTAQARPSNATP
jgi:hypothetical protein